MEGPAGVNGAPFTTSPPAEAHGEALLPSAPASPCSVLSTGSKMCPESLPAQLDKELDVSP